MANIPTPCATSRRRRVYHQGVSLVYHQHGVLYIIKPQEDARWRVMRYSPKGADDIHDCVVMICQACGLDKKIRQVETCRIFCIKTTKKIIFTVCDKDLNPSNVNEIVRCTMKSSLSSDEIFSLRLQMKSNPPIFCHKADFIAKRFHPPQVDLFRRGRI